MDSTRTWGRRVAALVALLVAVLGALVIGPAGPAQASPYGVICFPVYSTDGTS